MHLARLHFLKRRRKLAEDFRRCDRNIVCAENQSHLRLQCGQPLHRLAIGHQIRFWPEKPNWPGIVCVPGKELPIGAIEQANGIGRMPRRSDYFDSSSTQVDAVTVMQPLRHVPSPRRVRRTIKACRKRPAYFSRSNLRLRVRLRALRVLSGELGVHAVHRIELPVVPNVVVVRVAVEHGHG